MSVMDPNEARAILLEKAAEVLETDGWCQRVKHAPDGSHCLMGAIEEARIKGAPQVYGFYDTLCRLAEFGQEIPESGPTTPISLVMWNDAPGRTKDEVISLLRRSAAELRGTER